MTEQLLATALLNVTGIYQLVPPDHVWIAKSFIHVSLGGILGGALFLFLALTWRQISWWREPAWIKQAPTVPAPSWMALIQGSVIEFVMKGRICRTFMHPDQPDIIRLNKYGLLFLRSSL